MKPSVLLIVFVLLATCGGGSLFYYYQYEMPDVEFISRDVNARLLKIDGLNSSVSEYVLRSRVNIDTHYDALVQVTQQLEQETHDLEANYFSNKKLQGTELEQRFLNFKNALETKYEIIENFKSHNSVLRNSEKYAPQLGWELMFAAEEYDLFEVAQLYRELARGSMLYARMGSRGNEQKLAAMLGEIPSTESLLPKIYMSRIIELSNHIATVIREKNETDGYLNQILSLATDVRLDELSRTWNDWLVQASSQRDHYNLVVLGYIAILLLFSGYIAIRLRSFYESLDREVAQQTSKVEMAYKELSRSEKNLMKSEKLATLGQLVAGVAHEINTPLGYISCNLDTIRNSLADMCPLLKTSAQISKLLSVRPLDTNQLCELVKANVQSYRTMQKNTTINEVATLVSDSSEGIQEISNLVNSLKDYSRLDYSGAALTEVHSGLDTTIKICSAAIGSRKLKRYYANDLHKIECIPSQLNQVFMNILNNAVHATDADSGVIEIKTTNTDDGIKIQFRDNGQGMDESTRNRIFDPFFTTKEVDTGLGLGMSIAHKIIESHGGEILVASQPGIGTMITLRLPLKR